MKMTMKNWQDFLDSLSTAGGTILVLLFLFIGMVPLLVHVLRSPNDNDQVVTIVISTFTGIFSALMIALKGGSSRQQMVDRGTPPTLIANPAAPTPPAPKTEIVDVSVPTAVPSESKDPPSDAKAEVAASNESGKP